MSWSASQYLKFEDERARPVRDLLAAVPTTEVKRAVDLGCGPGNSTECLVARYPNAQVSAIGSSDEMLRAARQRLPGVPFARADLAAWREPGPFDVILANAVLHWVPDHATLLPRLVESVSAGGSLAVQMPDNLAEPSHVLMRQVAADGPWAGKLANANAERTQVEPAGWYYQVLRPLCQRVDVWRTIYHHPLAGIEAIVEWFRGTGLRPFLAPLEPAERAEFLERYRSALAAAYLALLDGSILMPFPRLFLVATR